MMGKMLPNYAKTPRCIPKAPGLVNSFDTAVYAVACIVFWACCHLSELLITSCHSFDLQSKVSCSCLKTCSIAKFGQHFSMLHLPKTKTNGQEGDDIYLIDCPLLFNQVNAFEHHLASSLMIPDDAPLFVWKSTNGSWCPMMKNWFMSHCKTAWKKEGVDMLDGHNFRIGGTTHHLVSSVLQGTSSR